MAMAMNNRYGIHGYFLTLIFAMCLNILPLPIFLKNFNPDWVLLVLIYWTMAIPERIGVFHAWFLGLFVDVLTGQLMGMHALAYALISYACLKFHKRLRHYPLLQQALFIFFCLLFSQMLVFWIESIQSETDFSYAFWLQVLIGAVCWPFVYFLLRYIRISGQFR